MNNQEILEAMVFMKKIKIEVLDNKIFINRFRLSLGETIGEGTYSVIYKCTDKKHNVHLALKVEKGTVGKEDDISRRILEKGCHTVNQRYIGYLNGENYYLMNLADGTLQDLKEKKDLKKNQNKPLFYKVITEEIRKQLICLYELGYVYTDIKLENIFYDFRNDSLRFFLGDLGSAVPDEDDYYISSFPPPEKREFNEKGVFRVNDEQIEDLLSWGIGMILFLLMNETTYHSNEFFFENTLSDRFHEKSLARMAQFYGKRYATYLSKNPKQRPSIYESINS
jgi:serine/threonine protein kinase